MRLTGILSILTVGPLSVELLLICSFLTVLALSACSVVPVHDEIFYGNKGVLGAVEFHTLTTDKRDLSMEEWMTILRTQPLICSSVRTFGDMKALYEKTCSLCNCCTADATRHEEDFFDEINKIARGK